MNTINLSKLCRTCFNEDENMCKIKGTTVTLERGQKPLIEILNLITNMEVRIIF